MDMKQGKAQRSNWMDGGKQNERGKMLMRAVGLAGKMAAGKQPAEQALQANTVGGSPPGSGLKTNGPQLAGGAAKTTAAG